MAAPQLSTYIENGRAVLRNTTTGKLTLHDPAKAYDKVASGQYVPVGKSEVAEADHQKQLSAHGGTGEQLATFGKAAVAGAIDVATAPLKIPVDAIAPAFGFDESPLKEAGGREVLSNLSYLAGEVFGDSGEKTQQGFDIDSRLQAEANPKANWLGSMTGQVASAAATGGLSLAAKGAGLAVKTAAGAAEGALLGGVQANEDAWFKDEDLTSEALLSSMGWGALIGGGASLTMGGAGKLFGRNGSRGATPFDSTVAPGELLSATGMAGDLAEKAAAESPGGLKNWLRSFSEERTVKALGARGTDLRKLGKTAIKAETEMRRMARDVLEAELDDGTKVFQSVQSQDKLVDNLTRAQAEAGEKLASFREKVNSFIETKAPEFRPDSSKIASRIESEVMADLTGSAIPDVVAKARPVKQIADTVRGMGDASLEKLTKMRQDLDSIIYPKPVGPGLPSLPPAHADQLVKVRGIIESEIEAATDKAAVKLGPNQLNKYATLKGKWRSFREANQIASKAQLQDLGNRVASPSDYLTGAAVLAGDMATGGGLSFIKAAAATAAHKAVREHGSSMLAVLTDRLAMNVDERIGKSIGGFMAKSAGLARLPAGTATAVRTIPVIGALEAFRGKAESNVAAYRQKVAEVMDANDNYAATVRDRTQQALGEMPERAPRLASKVATSATKAAQFLASKVPVPLRGEGFTPGVDAPTPSDADIAKFARYYNTVSNPMSALRDLETGQLTSEQAETLQVVWPSLFNRIRMHVIEQLGVAESKGKAIPYSAKMQLDLLLGLNGAGEKTASPEFLARFADIKAAVAQQQAQSAPQKQVNIQAANSSSTMDSVRKDLPT